MEKAPTGTLENNRGALRNINDHSAFTQTPLKIVEVGFQVADKQRRFVGRGNDGPVVLVEGQLDVVRR